jgi:hypothetical protein
MRTVGRVGAAGLVAGPVAFVGAWVLAARGIAGSSYVRDAISRTAAVDAPDRALMTAGFVAYSVGVGLGALALREALPGRAWVAAAVSAAGTAGVALAPLDVSDTVDKLHGVAATIGYVGLAATPLLAARPLADADRTGAARVSIAAGTVIAAALAATVVAGDASGLAQRVGLTTGDAWLIAAGATLLSRKR